MLLRESAVQKLLGVARVPQDQQRSPLRVHLPYALQSPEQPRLSELLDSLGSCMASGEAQGHAPSAAPPTHIPLLRAQPRKGAR